MTKKKEMDENPLLPQPNANTTPNLRLATLNPPYCNQTLVVLDPYLFHFTTTHPSQLTSKRGGEITVPSRRARRRIRSNALRLAPSTAARTRDAAAKCRANSRNAHTSGRASNTLCLLSKKKCGFRRSKSAQNPPPPPPAAACTHRPHR